MIKYKHGQLIRIIEGRTSRFWVALKVTAKDIAKGVQVTAPGVHFFTGYWYNDRRPAFLFLPPDLPTVRRGPKHHTAYGKVFDLGGKRITRHLAVQPSRIRDKGPRVRIQAGAQVTPFTANRLCK